MALPARAGRLRVRERVMDPNANPFADLSLIVAPAIESSSARRRGRHLQALVRGIGRDLDRHPPGLLRQPADPA